MKVHILFLLLQILFSISLIESDVQINEICTQNKNIYKDSYGSYSDWIELYNSGNSDFDLSGYGLSDDELDPLQFTFPEGTIIKPNSFLLIILSDQPSTKNEIHANFKLSKKGEKLLFSNKNGELIQSIDVPPLEEDTSFGKNSQGKFEIMSPTPLSENIFILPPPEFSHKSGFYPNNFNLILTSPTENSFIYYTIDGSDPLNSKTRKIYTKEGINIYDRSNEPNIYAEYEEDENSPVSITRGCGYRKPRYPIDKAMVVRAVSVTDNLQSKVVDNSYFIKTGNLAEYEPYLIVSLVTNPANLFDPEIGIYVTGKQYIDWITSPGYIPNPDKWSKTNKCNYYSKGEEWERDATVSFIEKGKLILQQEIGIRLKGSSTRNSPQKSFDLIARKKYGKKYFEYKFFEENKDLNGEIIEKYDTVTLRGTYGDERLRDKLGRDIVYDRKSVTTTWMKNCILFLNGEYWGMYELMEKLTPLFFEQHYGVKEKNLVILKENEIDEGPQEECDNYLSMAEQYSLSDLSNSKNYKELEQFFDMDSFAEHYAIGLYLGTWDWPLQNSGIWKNMGNKNEGNEYTDGKWRFLTYDLDFSMGLTFENYGGVEGYQYDNFRHIERRRGNTIPTNIFISLLRKNDIFRKKFINLYCDFANEVMKKEKIDLILNDYRETVTWMFANGKVRWWGADFANKLDGYAYNKNQFENNVLRKIETFFEERGINTLQHMKEFLNLREELVELNIIMKGNGKIKINTIMPNFKEGKWRGKYFTNIPLNISCISENNNEFNGWSGDISSNDKEITILLNKSTTTIEVNC